MARQQGLPDPGHAGDRLERNDPATRRAIEGPGGPGPGPGTTTATTTATATADTNGTNGTNGLPEDR
ncbi:hypothetical protein, partial [Streptomyces clavuligerus]|uniref:hypothetical protein n=1 Tax=Streptomyces clavuligerus TaxID=1901 RepID=UPI001E328A18